MSKYKVGDKVVMKIISADQDEIKTYSVSGVNNDWRWCLPQNLLERYIEPLSTYTEPLERKNENKQKQIEKLVDKLHRQAEEITRLLAENKELKAENGNVIWEIEQAFDRGCNAAWKLAQKIAKFQLDGGYSIDELKAIFGHPYVSEILDLTYTEAAEKVAEWEKAKEEIKVGDVLEGIYDNEVKCIVTNLCPDNMAYLVFDDGTAGVYELDNLKKTGRHIDVDSFLKQIGGEQEWQK